MAISSYESGVFLCVWKDKGGAGEFLEVADYIIEKCSDVYQIKDYDIKVSMNIGMSVYPNDGASVSELIKNANVAMNYSKNKGDNEAILFDNVLGNQILSYDSIAVKLKKLDYDKEFFLNFQPQFALEDKKLVAFEVLIRWKSDQGEWIPPGIFIPIAEETGSIITIGNWVLEETLKTIHRWKKSGKKKIKMAVNVSAKQLCGRGFVEKLKCSMEMYGVLPQELEIEIRK
jgi:predicted signal transduction protein with EAL and GGDEF domain